MENVDTREDPELLLEITRTFNRYTEFLAALGPALRFLENSTGLRAAEVALLDRETGVLKTGEGVTYRLGEGLPGRVFESEAPFTHTGPARSVKHCVPIFGTLGITGVLSAERRSGDESGESRTLADRAFLEKAASVMSDAIKLRERIIQEQQRPARETETPRRFPETAGTSGHIAADSGIVGADILMRDVYQMILRVAPSDATVLITGESGTGKELVATELHRLSRRAGGPLVKVNCAALPESIIESEFFGHEKGAFTGAVSQRRGRFELAQGGDDFSGRNRRPFPRGTGETPAGAAGAGTGAGRRKRCH